MILLSLWKYRDSDAGILYPKLFNFLSSSDKDVRMTKQCWSVLDFFFLLKNLALHFSV